MNTPNNSGQSPSGKDRDTVANGATTWLPKHTIRLRKGIVSIWPSNSETGSRSARDAIGNFITQTPARVSVSTQNSGHPTTLSARMFIVSYGRAKSSTNSQ